MKTMLMLKSNKVSNCKNINYVIHYSKYIIMNHLSLFYLTFGPHKVVFFSREKNVKSKLCNK